jgi:hypothetical protein
MLFKGLMLAYLLLTCPIGMKVVKVLLVSLLKQLRPHQSVRDPLVHLPKNRMKSEEEELKSSTRYRVQIEDEGDMSFKRCKNLYV